MIELITKWMVLALGILVCLAFWADVGATEYGSEETYNECYERILKQGGSENMVAWICGYQSGYFTDEDGN
jgi:hypothetical protein